MPDDGPFLNGGASHDDRIFHHGPCFHLNASKQDGVPDLSVDAAAVGDYGIFHQCTGADFVPGHTAVAAVDFPVLVKQVDAAVFRIQDFHVGFPQGGNGSHILPVAAEMISVHPAAVTQQVWDDVVAKVIFRVRVLLILNQVLFQDVPVKYVDAHGGQIGFGILGFFLEFRNPVILIRYHQTKTRRLFPRHFHDGHAELCPFFLVEPEEVAVILLAYLVAGKDDDVLRVIPLNEWDVLVNRIGRTLVPVRARGFLVGRKHVNPAVQAVQVPGLAVADILVEHQGLILGQDPHGIDT